VAKSRPKKAKKANSKVPANRAGVASAVPEQKTNEAQIAVHWKEEELFRPPASFIAQANLVDPAFVDSFREQNFPECFRQYANLLDWDKYWHTTLDTAKPPFWKWFVPAS
jgi:acetyl-CoA synthetase